MFRVILPLFTCILIFATGCVFAPYQSTACFDLTIAPIDFAPPQPVIMLEMRNDSSSGLRIQSRSTTGKIITDPYSQWVIPPGELVPRALNHTLLRDGVKNPIPLSGSIDRFEAEQQNQKFWLCGFYGKVGSTTRRFEISVPINGSKTEDTVAAASVAVAELAKRIAADKFDDVK